MMASEIRVNKINPVGGGSTITIAGGFSIMEPDINN